MLVSIHALLAECDRQDGGLYTRTLLFQSTHSLRSATMPLSFQSTPLKRFNPRTPCGVRLHDIDVSGFIEMFQSTHSLRSATQGHTSQVASRIVSIHALLAECDYRFTIRYRPRRVSIHALLAECDVGATNCAWPETGFNPRTPCGVRHAFRFFVEARALFQSTHSLRSATGRQLAPRHFVRSFNPRTPCGVRRIRNRPARLSPKFQSTHSLRSATNGGNPPEQ